SRLHLQGHCCCLRAQPAARLVGVNLAFPDSDKVQVIDVATLTVVQTLVAGKAVLHMEFTPRGEAVWLSARDDNKVSVYDTRSFKRLESLDIQHPSGVFFTHRSGRIGF